MTRTFKLIRDQDVTGVSGTGRVSVGALFDDGMAVLHWEGDPHTTTTLHPGGTQSILDIHGHNGKTRLVWDDEEPVVPFDDKDVSFLYTVLELPDDNFLSLHLSARKLLGKIRAMRARVPHQKSVL